MSFNQRKFDEDLVMRSSDKYLPEIPAEIFEPAKTKILAAIDNFHCTLPQIKKFAGFEPWEDLSEFLEVLEGTGIIAKVYNGMFTAFFRAEKVPIKFWLAGNNQVGVDYTTENKQVGQPKSDITQLAGREPILKSQKYEKLNLENNKEIQMQTQRNPILKSSNYSRKLIEVSESDVEKYASETSGRTVVEVQRNVALKLGIGWSTLMKKLTNNPSLKNAYKRGRDKFELTQGFATLPGEDLDPMGGLEESTQTIEQEHLESVSPDPENNTIKFETRSEWTPESPLAFINEAVPRAAPTAVEAVPVSSNRHTELLAKIKPEIPVNSPDWIEKYKSEIEPVFTGQLSRVVPSESITFKSGGSIEIFADLNLFQMDYDERAFVSQLISQIQDFKAKR